MYPDALYTGPSDCECPVPCDRTVFKPSLSYAQLSQFNIERLALADEKREAEIRQKFLTARETSQRVISHIAQTDDLQIETILSYMSNIDDIFKLSFHMMTNSSALAEHFMVADLIEEGYEAFASDMELINVFLHDKQFTNVEKLKSDIEDSIKGIQPVLDQTVGFLNLESENFKEDETFLSILMKCIQNGFYSYCNHEKVQEKNEEEKSKFISCATRRKRKRILM